MAPGPSTRATGSRHGVAAVIMEWPPSESMARHGVAGAAGARGLHCRLRPLTPRALGSTPVMIKGDKGQYRHPRATQPRAAVGLGRPRTRAGAGRPSQWPVMEWQALQERGVVCVP